MGGGFMGFDGRFLGLETGRRFAYEGFRGSDACVVDTGLMVGGRASLPGVVFMGLPRSLGLFVFYRCGTFALEDRFGYRHVVHRVWICGSFVVRIV
jgi:hypothetical protein